MSGVTLGSRDIDLNGSVGDWLVGALDVRLVERVHIEVDVRSGTWGTAVVELLKSGAGDDYYPFSPIIEFAGAERLVDIDVHDAAFLNIEIKTAEGSAGVGIFHFYGDGADTISTIAAPTYTEGLATRIDEASATITYVGKATPGTATSAGTWQVQRLTDTGSGLTVEWADGDDEFDNVWDSRAGLSYS